MESILDSSIVDDFLNLANEPSPLARLDYVLENELEHCHLILTGKGELWWQIAFAIVI
jgi:hypothetical protein